MIRTRGRKLVCTECYGEEPIPFGDMDSFNRAYAAALNKHADCKRPEEGYVTERGVRVIDRRKVRA